MSNIKPTIVYEPQYNLGQYAQAYSLWLSCVEKSLSQQVSSGKIQESVKRKTMELEQDLKTKNRELAAITLQMVTKNDLLLEVQDALQTTAKTNDSEALKAIIRKLTVKIESHLNNTSDWDAFEAHFNLLHSDFFKKLKGIYPGLTIPELKMCAFIKMGLSTKEIAQRLNLSMRGTETGRFRLRKKLDLVDGMSFQVFLDTL
nr:hypothetical protein [Haliscomenobacter sp.]